MFDVCIVGIATRAAGVAIDVAVILFTWYKTYGIKRESRRLGVNTPYVTLLLRDGEFDKTVLLEVSC